MRLIHEGGLKAEKTLFMTATPKVYVTDDNKKGKRQEGKDVAALAYSMDDEKLFGPEFYRYSFADAIKDKVLCDYKVVVFKVPAGQVKVPNFKADESVVAKEPEFPGKVLGAFSSFYLNPKESDSYLDGKLLVSAQKLTDLTSPLIHKAIVYTSSIKNSKWIESYFNPVLKANGVDEASETIEVKHVDGKMDSEQRHERLDWLKKDEGREIKILSNAKCLTEGIDLPALDSVIFFSPKRSKIDITQAIGRAMRKAPGKEFGYILIPIVCDNPNDADEVLSTSRYKVLWEVLQGLRSVDERMDIAVNAITLKKEAEERSGGASDEPQDAKPKALPFDFHQAVEAAILKHCGSTVFWENWAESIKEVVEKAKGEIKDLTLEQEEMKELYGSFKDEMEAALNRKGIPDSDLVDMLSQQVILAPVFRDLFPSAFLKNPMARALAPITEALSRELDIEKNPVISDLLDNIKGVSSYFQTHPDPNSKEELIRKLYNDFYQAAFPEAAKRLGVTYTPPQIVDFMLYEANELLKKEFGEEFSSERTQILDPFSGTGTYLARLLSNEKLMTKEALERKYASEEARGIWANEILLVPYYIMSLAIQSAYEGRCVKDKAEPKVDWFKGACFTDTFYAKEIAGKSALEGFSKNTANVKAENDADINVIVSNPPYSARNDNDSYRDLDGSIKKDYGEATEANNKNTLYDDYIRAFWWASDRIGNRGIVGFITNSSWLTQPTYKGVREAFRKEFDGIFVINLRGHGRNYSDKAAGESIFEGKTVSTAITFLVKNPEKTGYLPPKGPYRGTIHYAEIDGMKRSEKLAELSRWTGGEEIPWRTLEPDSHGDWLDQRKEGFDDFIPVFDKEGKKFDCGARSVFTGISSGIVTASDTWLYNFSKGELLKNVETAIDFYNSELLRWEKENEPKDVKEFVRKEPEKIHWGPDLLKRLKSHRFIDHPSPSKLRICLYRPFAKEYLYYEPLLIARTYRLPNLFPENLKNRAICITEKTSDFSALMTNTLPDSGVLTSLSFKGSTRALPLYWYEKDEGGKLPGSGIRRSAISQKALELFRKAYGDESISPEDIFYYTYGILNSKEYKDEWSSNFKYQLPHIPLSKNFRQFADIGRKLGKLHEDYELQIPYREAIVEGVEEGKIKKMKLQRERKGTLKLFITDSLCISNIPEEVLDYKVGGMSPLEWIAKQYQAKVDSHTGIANDPNAVGIKYIKGLALSLITVSLESSRLINSLPPIDEIGLEEGIDYKRIWKGMIK